MKKQISSLLFGSIIVVGGLFVYGCGGGGSATPTNTPTQGSFEGAVAKGDYAKFSIYGNKLTYNISGIHFGGENGTLDLDNVFGNFWKSTSPEVYIFTSGNLGISVIPELKDGKDAFIVGLKTTEAPDANKFAGKTYVYAEIKNDGAAPTGRILTVNADKTFFVDQNAIGMRGCWKVIDNHVAAKITEDACDPSPVTENNADFNAIVKPGDRRNGLIIDYIDGTGFGLGLEQKALAAADITGTYYSYWYDGQDEGFGKVIANADFSYTWHDCDASGNCTEESTGVLQVNQLCDGTAVAGAACAEDADGSKSLVFIDSEDGYYIAVDDHGNSINIGSNK